MKYEGQEIPAKLYRQSATYQSLPNRIIFSPLTHIAITTIERNKQFISELSSEKIALSRESFLSKKKHELLDGINNKIRALMEINESLNYYINYRLTN